MGAYRKKAKRKERSKMGRPRKNHRNKMESIIFVFKKVLGEHLSATSSLGHRQQTRFRIIAHNAYVKAKRLIMRDFYAPLFWTEYCLKEKLTLSDKLYNWGIIKRKI